MKVLISGIGKGLGKALTQKFVAENCQVFGILRDINQLNDYSKEELLNIIPIVGDVRNDDIVTKIKSVIGLDTIDLLINNAGIGGVKYKLKEIERDEIRTLLDVHCIGAFNVTKACIDNILKSNNPTIININSRLGSIYEQNKGTFNHLETSYSYRIAKAAQNMFTNCLMNEFGDNIKIYSVNPGKLKTEIAQSDADLSVEEASKNIYDAWVNNKFPVNDGIIEIGKQTLNW